MAPPPPSPGRHPCCSRFCPRLQALRFRCMRCAVYGATHSLCLLQTALIATCSGRQQWPCSTASHIPLWLVETHARTHARTCAKPRSPHTRRLCYAHRHAHCSFRAQCERWALLRRPLRLARGEPGDPPKLEAEPAAAAASAGVPSELFGALALKAHDERHSIDTLGVAYDAASGWWVRGVSAPFQTGRVALQVSRGFRESSPLGQHGRCGSVHWTPRCLGGAAASRTLAPRQAAHARRPALVRLAQNQH